MRGSVAKYQIRLKRKQKRWLEAVIRRRNIGHWLVLRARIVLESRDGRRVCETARVLAIDEQRVRRWRKRFLKGGGKALKDRQRGGRPRSIPMKTWQKLAIVVVQCPRDFGVALNRWTVRELSAFMARRYKIQISRSSVSRFLRGMALKPHRMRYWLNPEDPHFDEKAAKICKIYVSPPKGTTVLCIDEKPGVVLRTRKHPDRPMWIGRVLRREFEYQRHGTRCILAAFNIRNGRTLTWVTRNRKTKTVFEFLDRIRATYPRGPILLITDNISTRTGKAAKQWLKKHPRRELVEPGRNLAQHPQPEMPQGSLVPNRSPALQCRLCIHAALEQRDRPSIQLDLHREGSAPMIRRPSIVNSGTQD